MKEYRFRINEAERFLIGLSLRNEIEWLKRNKEMLLGKTFEHYNLNDEKYKKTLMKLEEQTKIFGTKLKDFLGIEEKPLDALINIYSRLLNKFENPKRGRKSREK
jgi:predicted metallo-beta-lactamase superfamily hydrolase